MNLHIAMINKYGYTKPTRTVNKKIQLFQQYANDKSKDIDLKQFIFENFLQK